MPKRFVIMGIQVYEPVPFAHIVEAENEVEATARVVEQFQQSGFDENSDLHITGAVEFPTE